MSDRPRELRPQGYPVGRTKSPKCCDPWAIRCKAIERHAKAPTILIATPSLNTSFAESVPDVSVDTKKKETLGNKANVGRQYRPQGEPLEVDTHDFPDKKLGKAIPYGVYDIDTNEAWVSAGKFSRDTAEFAVEAIRRWWHRLGKKRYAQPKRV